MHGTRVPYVRQSTCYFLFEGFCRKWYVILSFGVVKFYSVIGVDMLTLF